MSFFLFQILYFIMNRLICKEQNCHVYIYFNEIITINHAEDIMELMLTTKYNPFSFIISLFYYIVY